MNEFDKNYFIKDENEPKNYFIKDENEPKNYFIKDENEPKNYFIEDTKLAWSRIKIFPFEPKFHHYDPANWKFNNDKL